MAKSKKRRKRRGSPASPASAAPQAAERRGSASRTASPPTPTSALARENLPALALLLIVLVSFYPAFSAGFVWDDEIFTAAEAVREWSGLFWLWFEPSRLENEGHYWPLVYSTFWLEHKLWGFDPTGYHIVNLALHGINAVLLWRILGRLEVPGAWLVAALFAAHPMQAEAVAWIMGRKDLLSTLFYLTAAGCWLRYRRRPRTGTMVLMSLLFAAGMLSKSMVITLPAVLLLCVWWKEGRISLADLKQVLPLFVVGAGIVSIDLLRYSALARHDFDYSWLERLLIACRALWFYALKLLWPEPLQVIYAHWDSSPGNPLNWLCLAGAAAVAGTLWLLRGRIGRGPLAGALFFAVTLSPVLGFSSSVYMAFSFVADRYQYLASVGLWAVLVGGLAHVLGKAGPRAVFAARFPAALLLAVYAGLAMRQAALFENEVSLFSHAVSLNPAAGRAHFGLGRALVTEGRTEEGLAAFRLGLERDPKYERTHDGIGWALLKLERYAEAEEHLRRALEAKASDKQTMQNLAESLRVQGRFDEALTWYDAVIEIDGRDTGAHTGRAKALQALERYGEAQDGFERALELDPDDEALHSDIGWTLFGQQRYAEAEKHLRRAVAANPTDREALQNLAESLRAQGRFEEALPWYDAAIELDGHFSHAHFGRAKALGQLGRYDAARDGFERALELGSNDDKVYGEIGWVLLNLQRYAEAEGHLRRAAQANPADKETLQNLAESLRAQGRFEEAASRYEAVIELDGGDGHAHAGRAIALGQLGRYDAARAGFERALAAAPELETLLADLPVFRRAMGLESR